MQFNLIGAVQKKIRTEKVFKVSLVIIALLMIVIALGVFLTLVVQSMPSIKALGIGYLWGSTWDPVGDVYGALPFLLGTLITSFLALLSPFLFLMQSLFI